MKHCILNNFRPNKQAKRTQQTFAQLGWCAIPILFAQQDCAQQAECTRNGILSSCSSPRRRMFLGTKFKMHGKTLLVCSFPLRHYPPVTLALVKNLTLSHLHHSWVKRRLPGCEDMSACPIFCHEIYCLKVQGPHREPFPFGIKSGNEPQTFADLLRSANNYSTMLEGMSGRSAFTEMLWRVLHCS